MSSDFSGALTVPVLGADPTATPVASTVFLYIKPAGLFQKDSGNTVTHIGPAGTISLTTPAAHGITLTAAPYVAPAFMATDGSVTLARAAANELHDFLLVSVVSATELLAIPGETTWDTTAAHGLTLGQMYWSDQTTAGALTGTQPGTGIVQPVLVPLSANKLLFRALPGYTA